MSNLKKVLALALALAMVMTMFAGASIKTVLNVKDADQFTDAQLDAAALLQPLGVLAGMGADELGAGIVTRPQMVAFIYRLVNGGDKGVEAYYSKTSQYKDVDPNAWYAPYINWALATKVAFGYTDGNFGVNDNVTGAQAAAMLVRLLGKDASGADYALQAQNAAITLGLDHGITTKGLYEGELARGDMFILLANALLTEVKGTTIAESVFDLEIIEGAILTDAAKKYGTNDYTLFTFRLATASADIETFWAATLRVEEKSDVKEDLGCKYILLVSKTKDYLGYRQLYAAYEMENDGYYKVVTGTVDDGAFYDAKGNFVPKFDSTTKYYVDGKEATFDAFIACYGKANKAPYKLIDNDGDGVYEYAFIERWSLATIKADTVIAKITAISAKGEITLTTEDGTVISGLTYGEYATFDKSGAFTGFASEEDNIKTAMGIQQPNYAPFAGISDTYYSFSVKDGYLYGVGISEKTAFAAEYGIFVKWSSPVTMYKNMPYALMMNSNNEYFYAYVASVNENATYFIGNPYLEDTLIYFTDGDYSDDVVSFVTADFWNKNETYKYYEAIAKVAEVPASLTLTFEGSVVSTLQAKTTNYTNLTVYGEICAVFKADADLSELKYWDADAQAYAYVSNLTEIDAADRCLGGYPFVDYRDLEDKQFVLISGAAAFYGCCKLDECIGFVYITDNEIKLDLTIAQDPDDEPTFQIYMANGFWHLRDYYTINNIAAGDVSYTYMGHEIVNVQDVYYIDLGDQWDPESDSDYVAEEMVRLAELVKGFDDDAFQGMVDDAIADLVDEINEQAGEVRGDYTLLNASHGTVFAYGSVVVGGAKRWVAYNADTWNADFGDPANNSDDDNITFDEMIYTVLGGQIYVKAMKINSARFDLLPYGWIEPDGYEVVVFGGFTGAVNTNGWEIAVLTLDPTVGVKTEKIYTKIGMGGAEIGDVLFIKRDAEGAVIEITPVGGYDYVSYVHYYINGELSQVTAIGGGKVTVTDTALVFEGDDENGNYYRYTVDLEGMALITVTIDAHNNPVISVANGIKSGEYIGVVVIGDYVIAIK